MCIRDRYVYRLLNTLIKISAHDQWWSLCNRNVILLERRWRTRGQNGRPGSLEEQPLNESSISSSMVTTSTSEYILPVCSGLEQRGWDEVEWWCRECEVAVVAVSVMSWRLGWRRWTFSCSSWQHVRLTLINRWRRASSSPNSHRWTSHRSTNWTTVAWACWRSYHWWSVSCLMTHWQ